MVAYADNPRMQLLTTVLDWCFPPRADELRLRTLHSADIRIQPSYPEKRLTALLPFNHPTVRALVHEAKFHHNQRAHQLLGQVAADYITQHFADALLVPIPLHPTRERKRGFNQVTACLRTQPQLAQSTVTNLLTRQRNTAPQTTLQADARWDNLANAFVVSTVVAQKLPPQRPLLLIDDVYTTGATLHAARNALTTALPHQPVLSLAFAYA